jgi:D-glycero-D-manno-heptose 1,7-bisphosphate phosphatase
MKKAIFLDRDGTIIVDKNYLNDPNQIEYLPNVFEAFKLWNENGFVFVIVTNQSGIHKGIIKEENVVKIHQKIAQRMLDNKTPILEFYYAPHAAESDHPMRKPNPGMLIEAAKKHKIDLTQSWMVGDKMSDVEAGHRAGCRSILYTYQSKEDDSTSSYLPAEIIGDDLLNLAQRSLRI